MAKSLLSFRIVIAIAFASHVSAASAAAAEFDCPKLYAELWAHSEEAMKSLEPSTNFFYWGRARVAIEATPNETLEKIFKTMSKEDLHELFWGNANVAPKERKMIEELYHMVDDLGDKPFWGPAPDRGYAIRKALRAHDTKLSYSGNPAFAAELQDKALGKTEIELMARALGEHEKNTKYANSKWYDRVVRFFSPHYQRVQQILAANNSIRRRLQKMYEMDKPALDAIAKYEKTLKLNEAELRELQGQASDTAGQLNEARKDIKDLYGREVSTSKPLPTNEIRIRDLAKKSVAADTNIDEAKLGITAERDMDTIDRVIGQAWGRGKKTDAVMPLAEKHDVHLQIRYPQYRRETPELRSVYQNITETRVPKDAEYNVKIQWTVTVSHEEQRTRKAKRWVTQDGKQVEEEYDETYTHTWTSDYEMYRDDVLEARYEEVLQNDVTPSNHMSDLPPLPPAEERGMHSVSAENGTPSITWVDSSRTNRILQQGANARKSETPFRDQIASSTELVNAITVDSYKAALKTPGGAKKILVTLEAEEKVLRAAQEKLAKYAASDSGSVRSQWAQDKQKDFEDRNGQMLTRFTHMITRVTHLAEQVRRESPTLVIEYTLPSYDAQLARLKEIADKNKKIIVRTSTGAAVTAAGTTGFVYREEIMEKIRELTSKEPGYR